jgi:hypothetical protein
MKFLKAALILTAFAMPMAYADTPALSCQNDPSQLNVNAPSPAEMTAKRTAEVNGKATDAPAPSNTGTSGTRR